jgi:hypothetical protein
MGTLCIKLLFFLPSIVDLFDEGVILLPESHFESSVLTVTERRLVLFRAGPESRPNEANIRREGYKPGYVVVFKYLSIVQKPAVLACK